MNAPAPIPAKPQEKEKKIKWLPILVAVCLFAGLGAYWYKSTAGNAKARQDGKNRPTPVVVTEAKSQDVEVFLTSLGTVTPQNTVTVRSRVDGELMRVFFREGQMVKAGEPLVIIDPRPFQVQLAQAVGQQRRDQALLENARMDLKRYTELMAHGAVPRQQYDTQLSLVKQYEGTVATDRATADNARLQITYSRITSPISGQVGLRQVDPGNMIHANDTGGLLVVNQIAPINVVFTLAEDQLPGVLERLRAGRTLRVDAYDRSQSRKLAEGELASLDNQIDTSTGTVKLKASFKNDDHMLYPNQFVNAKLLLDVLKDAIVVPTAALQHGQQGAYVFVLNPRGDAVSARPVSAGDTGQDGVTVIMKGLALGEKVVVDGAERLRDGSPVRVRTPRRPQGATQNATDPAPQARSAATAQNGPTTPVPPPAPAGARPAALTPPRPPEHEIRRTANPPAATPPNPAAKRPGASAIPARGQGAAHLVSPGEAAPTTSPAAKRPGASAIPARGQGAAHLVGPDEAVPTTSPAAAGAANQ